MSDWEYCKICGEYVDLTSHRQGTRVYEARFDPEDDWQPICGDYLGFIDDNGFDLESAAQRFCAKSDREDSYQSAENRTVWVRPEGEDGDGTPYEVETRMVPEYHATEMKPCAGGCGTLTAYGYECQACMRKKWEAERAVKAEAKLGAAS